jgi:MoaA/NifB/PqqE/SkfB family radical SAM enzyme
MPEVEWLITEKCNFRCSYCNCANGPHTPSAIVGDVLRYIGEVFGATKLNLCGGEPLVSPDIKQVARYCREHRIYLSMDSNISLPIKRILDILQEGDSYFDYVHTTLHPEFHDFDGFCSKVRAIRETGRKVDVRLIALHDRWDAVLAEYARLQDAGMNPRPKLEKYRRRDLSIRPPSRILPPYTEEQLAWVGAEMKLSRAQLFEEYAYHSFKGMPCNSGAEYVYIDVKGFVYRCASGEKVRDPLGHVKTITVPRTGPTPCPYGICPCREAQRLDLLAPARSQRRTADQVLV